MSTEEKKDEILEDIEDLEDVDSPSDQVEEESEELVDIDKELEAARGEVAETKDKMMRLAAEFENYKKRMERERANAIKYAGEPILREFLPVIDNLERAIDHIEGADPQQSLDSLVEGVELTLKGLLTSLEKLEVAPIDSIGKPFDPTLHDALTMEASDEIENNHVVSEFEKGYHYKDRLLRVAKVIVSSGKSNG
ncbi:MAG: nucleotide exchange factor GrpE [Thermodesulfobacteriota bacterium]